MNFEILYSKLPNFIKYNKSVFNFSAKMAPKLRNLNKKTNQFESQHQLLNLLFTQCDIKITGPLRNFQILYVELLRFVDNVCNKYEIDYWLDYGALLGAVRHGGFIPWDDDIDVSLMRKDYEKLIEVLPLELSKHPELKEKLGITLLVAGHENHFKDFKSVYDIEDKNNVLNEEKFCFLQLAWLKPYVKIDFFAKDYINSNELDKYRENYGVVKYKFNKEIQKKTDADFFEELESSKKKMGQTNNKTDYCGNSVDYIIVENPTIFKINNIFPLKTIEFEGHNFKCPNNVEKHLETKYGQNYMRIPKIIEHHDIIKFIETQFETKDDMNKAFKCGIECLKKINEEF